MKKLTLLVFAVFMLPFLVKAQEGTIKVTGILSPQVSFLFNNDDSDAGPELDYATTFRFGGGIGAEYGLSDYVNLGLDLYLSPEGQKYTGVSEVATNKYEMDYFTRLTYLKIPFYVKFTSAPDAAHFQLLVGPQVNILVGGKTTYTLTQNGEKIQDYEGVKGEGIVRSYDPATGNQVGETVIVYPDITYSTTLFGAFFGLGMGFPIADNMILSTILRFDYTFGDVENKDAKAYLKADPTQTKFEVWATKPKFNMPGTSTPTNFKAADRAKTSAVTGALQIRFAYVIGG